jgi:hypothetical protein
MLDKAAAALSLPGVLALQTGARRRAGRTVAGAAPTVVVTVERKVGPEALAAEEDLRNLFGAEHVDVVEATPLKALFAQPEKYGVDAATLADIEARIGYPFTSDTIGVRPARMVGAAREAAARRAEISYRPPDNVSLEPLRGRVKLRCHASPDAGWKELRRFLRAARRELVVGMYELTAPHVGDLLAEEVAERVGPFKLIMDKKLKIGSGLKLHDRTEEAHARMLGAAFGDGFEHAFAFTSRAGGTFVSDYHIKLAVRDRKAFWMSSGSWQSSNQPNLDPLGPEREERLIRQCNREWHLTCEHAGAADMWAKFLEWDLETAQQAAGPQFDRFAAALHGAGPLVFMAVRRDEFPYEEFWDAEEFEFTAGDGARVVPLLTPEEIYLEEVSKLVRGARDELLVQNQSLGFYQNEEDQHPRFTEFARLLAERSHELSGFRLILRDPEEFGSSAEDALETYRDKGFNPDRIRFQAKCHNKGIIADGRRVLLGSHNFTSAGTTGNRDASLLIEHEGVAAYYRRYFEHDWSIAGRLAQQRAGQPRPRMLLARPGELPPRGMTAYSFWELLDDD